MSEISDRALALQREVEAKLPDFVAMVRMDTDYVLLHQDAFAADYQEAELRLLGLAVKYAGIYGRELRIMGTNRQTVSRD